MSRACAEMIGRTEPMDGHAASDLGDERREFRRIDDRLLLEYVPIADGDSDAGVALSAGDDAIHLLLAQSTTDLMSRLQTPELAALAPWLLKIDWTLELMLKTLRRLSKDGVSIPQLTDVNISAAGVRFQTSHPCAEGDRLAVQLILPPFTPIRAIALVTRVLPGHRPDEHELATQFVEINEDDRERLIRHILQVEAERLRARRVPTL